MSSPPAPSNCAGGFKGLFNCISGTALNNEGQTVGALVAALAASFASLGIQLLVFVILRLRLSRIYQPKSYLVPERERLPQPPGGIVGWLYPLFTSTNLSLIQKCGLDAYFFLRFLRLLLKVFFPAAILIIPILLPLNHSGGRNQKGLDRYSISNIGKNDGNRLWAHLILAVMFIFWFFYIVFKELRGYIRVRQAFLTSPQHRIRASATTVLVTGIPRKWLTLEALSGLYDVFPGGIRNIWINRNFDELAEKVELRDKIAKSLEDAETVLIKLCRKKHMKAEASRLKKQGKARKTKQEKQQDQDNEDAAAEQMAQGQGVSAGETHEVAEGMQDILDEEGRQQEKYDKRAGNPFGAVGQGLNAVGQGIGSVGKGLGRFGGKFVGGVDQGLHKAGNDFNRATEIANTGGFGGGFVADDSVYSGPTGSPLKAATSPPHGDRTANRPRAGSNTQKHPLAQSSTRPLAASAVNMDGMQDSRTSGDTLITPDKRRTLPSGNTKPMTSMHIQEPPSHRNKRKFLGMFANNDKSLAMPSPQPHVQDDDEFPLHANAEKTAPVPKEHEVSESKMARKLRFWRKDDDDKEEKETYPTAFDNNWDEDQDEEPYWRRYIEPGDRETMRLPLVKANWFPSLPLIGKKVDRIYHLRRELARLNLEIETDQNDVEKFPLMNSAFIQFNHQVAAHMCCQSLSHHIPQQMAPRLVEISPDDILWDNMAIKWWERYVRTGLVLLICAGLVILYAIPVAFTSLLNRISTLAAVLPWLDWLNDLPDWVKSIIQGILPPALLGLILALVPIIFRLLVKQQGVATGNAQELGVQVWYFAFLFIQVFLVVTIAGGLTSFFSEAAANPGSIVQKLATNLPKASNYFYSYLTVQALSNSASSLLQSGTLFTWFILAPFLDSTARAKWRRQTNLSDMQWGTFFPPFTNFAAIGLVYSIISPLILVFMLLIFGVFWIVYRYNVLYVYRFRNDTGGLLFPTAINQLFTGLYFLELCLIGLFFTITDEHHKVQCLPQAIIMIVMLIGTVTYQVLLNQAFKPLYSFLPITLEDEAVIRDEQFAKAQASKFAPLNGGDGDEQRDIQEVLADNERQDREADDAASDAEKRDIQKRRQSSSPATAQHSSPRSPRPGQWHERKQSKPAWASEKWKRVAPEAVSTLRFLADGKRPGQKAQQDTEAQHTVGDILFSGFADELEDLTPEERDLLVRYAFQHSALRARRPVVWIPRDTLGVSDDEIKRAKKMSTVKIDSGDGGQEEKTNIWMSNEGTALDGRGRVVFRRSPPDLSNVDLIAL